MKYIQWTGNNVKEVLEFCEDALSARVINLETAVYIRATNSQIKAERNDYITKDSLGNFFIIKPESSKCTPIEFVLGSWFRYNGNTYVLTKDIKGEPHFEKMEQKKTRIRKVR